MPRHSGSPGQKWVHDPVPGSERGTGTPGSLAVSALHKQMARASLSRLLACLPLGSWLHFCLAAAVTIISEPQDPAPLIVAAGVKDPRGS